MEIGKEATEAARECFRQLSFDPDTARPCNLKGEIVGPSTFAKIIQRAIDAVMADPVTAYAAGRAAGDVIVGQQRDLAAAEKALLELKEVVRDALGPLPTMHEGSRVSITIQRKNYERLQRALL